MGWLFVHRDSSQSIADFLKQRFNSTALVRSEVVDCAVAKLKTAYLAVRVTDKYGLSAVYGCVCLLDYAPRDHLNFGFKVLDEVMGPYAAECPERILKQLTPLEDEAYCAVLGLSSHGCAKEWRASCWANIARRVQLKAGDRLRSRVPVRFCNGTRIFSDFVVQDARRCIVTGPDGRLYKLSRDLINTQCEVV